MKNIRNILEIVIRRDIEHGYSVLSGVKNKAWSNLFNNLYTPLEEIQITIKKPIDNEKYKQHIK